MEQKIKAPFIPPKEDNFDQKNINEEWKDLDDPQFKENQVLLRRNSVQQLFEGYYYDYQIAALGQNHQGYINTGDLINAAKMGKIVGVSPSLIAQFENAAKASNPATPNTA